MSYTWRNQHVPKPLQPLRNLGYDDIAAVGVVGGVIGCLLGGVVGWALGAIATGTGSSQDLFWNVLQFCMIIGALIPTGLALGALIGKVYLLQRYPDIDFEDAYQLLAYKQYHRLSAEDRIQATLAFRAIMELDPKDPNYGAARETWSATYRTLQRTHVKDTSPLDEPVLAAAQDHLTYLREVEKSEILDSPTPSRESS